MKQHKHSLTKLNLKKVELIGTDESQSQIVDLKSFDLAQQLKNNSGLHLSNNTSLYKIEDQFPEHVLNEPSISTNTLQLLNFNTNNDVPFYQASIKRSNNFQKNKKTHKAQQFRSLPTTRLSKSHYTNLNQFNQPSKVIVNPYFLKQLSKNNQQQQQQINSNNDPCPFNLIDEATI